MSATPAKGKRHVLMGVFSDLRDAEAAVADLRDLGLMDEDIGLIIPEPGAHQGLEGETRAIEELRATAKGMAFAAPIGSLAGMGVVAFAVAGAPTLAVAVVGGAVGALWGMFFGAVGGFSARVRMDDDEDLWYEVPMKTGEILLVAHVREKANEAHEVLHRHNVKCFLGQECQYK